MIEDDVINWISTKFAPYKRLAGEIYHLLIVHRFTITVIIIIID